MTDAAYERPSRRESAFLARESADAPLHLGGVHVFEAAPFRKTSGAVDIDGLRDHVAAALHRVPRYRQRLARTPLARRPVWVDDERFDLPYHVRHTRLPYPGDERQLKRAAGQILSPRLDGERPLWELWLLEGLEGDRVAVVTKVHPCLVDGTAGGDLLSLLLSDARRERSAPASPWSPRPAPPRARLACDELLRAAEAPLALATALGPRGRERPGAPAVAEQGRAPHFAPPAPLARPEGSLERPVGPHRRVDWITFPLDELRAVKRALGGTVTDVVLATAAGALRRFGTRRRAPLAERALRAMLPVCPAPGPAGGAPARSLSAWIVELPLGEGDPARRYEAIRRETRALEESEPALGAERLAEDTGWTAPGLLALGARDAERSPFDLVLANVPGPQARRYLLGARMLEAHASVPVTGRHAVGLALFSFAGGLSWGFTADRELVPDLPELVRAVKASFAELRRLAGLAGPRPAPEPAPEAEPPAPIRLGPGATPGRVRRRILQDHVELRGRLDELEPLAARVLAGEPELGGRLHEQGARLRERFLEHIDLEDAYLVPALREADAWGEERARRVSDEHADQRARLDELLEDLRDEARPVDALAREIQALARDLRDEMAHEDEAVLRDDVLRDDVVSVAAETG